MNIFYLDNDTTKCAEYHVDKHVVKMITEHNQLLCTANWISGKPAPYKKTHQNHPSAIWARDSKENYIYLCELTLKLCNEYTHRYGKVHAGKEILKWCMNNVPKLKDKPFSPPVPAMDDKFKVIINGKVDSLQSYRNYYKHGKTHLYSWKKRDIPSWLI